MAQAKRNNSRSNGKSNRSSSNRKNYSNSKRTNSNSRSGSRSKSSPNVVSGEETSFVDYFHAFTKTSYFKPVLTVLIIVFVVLIDLLIAWNSFDKFFKILGFELIIIAMAWVIGLMLSISKDSFEDSDEDEDE